MIRASGNSPRIALIEYDDGEKSYVLAPEGLKAGDKIISGEECEPRVGNCPAQILCRN